MRFLPIIGIRLDDPSHTWHMRHQKTEPIIATAKATNITVGEAAAVRVKGV